MKCIFISCLHFYDEGKKKYLKEIVFCLRNIKLVAKCVNFLCFYGSKTSEEGF